MAAFAREDASRPEHKSGLSIWCLVANVTREAHPEGPAQEPSLGMKHFAPGAKLYCFPKEWGDGREKLRVLGRHRGGGPKLIEIVISTKWLTDWRVQQVFHPYVVHAMQGRWDDTDDSKTRATELAEAYKRKSGGEPPSENQ